MASFQPLNVLLYGKLYLPALSLAFLTGFTFSITLPSALQALLPAMESLFYVSLPHLWQASVRWFTPPCLFLLLNGIIMILTATTGKPSSSPPSQAPTNLLKKLDKLTSSKDGVASAEPSLATTSAIEATPTGIESSSLLPLQLTAPIVAFSDIPVCYRCLQSQDAVMEEVKLPGDDGDGNNVHYHAHEDVKEAQTVEMVERLQLGRIDDPAISSCEEILKVGSEPSTPKYSSASSNNTKRSLSVDSAPCIDDGEDSTEYKLSEEAFRKRIEDYIYKVNAKLRSETTFI